MASARKNMFALGLLSWMAGRELEHSEVIREVLARKLRNAEANNFAGRWNYGETNEAFVAIMRSPAILPPRRPAISAIPLARDRGGRPASGRASASYPITRRRHPHETVRTRTTVVNDVAASALRWCRLVLGTSTSGTGNFIESSALGFVMTELPLLVIDSGGAVDRSTHQDEQADGVAGALQPQWRVSRWRCWRRALPTAEPPLCASRCPANTPPVILLSGRRHR